MLRTIPPINDLTTTADNPPVFFVPGRSRAGASLGRAARQAHAGYYRDLQPLHLDVPASRVLDAAVRLARSQWQEVVVDYDGLRLQAIAITPLLRFRDDVVLELRQASATGCEVHMRSKSRLGRGDLGANARRIKAFLDQLRQSFVV